VPSALLTLTVVSLLVLRRVERRSNRLTQRGIHEIGADMGVDRGRGVTAVPDLFLDEPAIGTVLGQMGDEGYL
jgi:hypothetical protein